jgi:hypothetical protein
MAVAGVIACDRVVDTNPILIVGAMGIRADPLPITGSPPSIRASSGVGVAPSVTSIPAGAYLDVAAGLGEATKALAALAAPATNVADDHRPRGHDLSLTTPVRQPPQYATRSRLANQQR